MLINSQYYIGSKLLRFMGSLICTYVKTYFKDLLILYNLPHTHAYKK